MDYKKMWTEMKSTYEQRLIKLEKEQKKGSNAWVNAKRFVDVMEGFELREQKQVNHSKSDGMDEYHFRRYKEEN